MGPAVVSCLADIGYVGYWRVLDAQHFGVPQKRRRVFLAAGLGEFPPLEFLSDAGTMESVSVTAGPQAGQGKADRWASYTLCAPTARARINLGCEVLVAEEDGWGSMVERARVSRVHGFPLGLDDLNRMERYAAGNAVVPAVAEWAAGILAGAWARPV